MIKKGFSLFKRNLAVQIVVGLILGIIVGVYLNEIRIDPTHSLHQHYQSSITNFFKPLGDILITMIKMIVVPIVVTTLTVGIASMEDAKKIGTMGVKTIFYFEVITTVAIFVGLFAANVFHPGSGIDLSALGTGDISQYQQTLAQTEDAPHGLVVMILSMIPKNVVYAMANGDLLPLIFFSVLFGIGLVSLPTEQKEPVLKVLKGISETMFVVTNIIMRYAPIGVFGLIAMTVGQYGFDSLISLFKLVLLVYAAMFFFVAVVLGGVARFCGLRMSTICRILKEELILAFSTASSETVLPKIMEKMEKYGAPKSITGFVLPTGYSFNLDGSTLYQSIAVIFIAQIYNIDLSLIDQITIVITLMIASKGIAGVPGVSFVVLSATLASVGLPIEGLAFIIGVDRLMDMGRTAVNVMGNSLAILVIAKWEKQFDTEKAKAYEAELDAAKGKVST
ncbi:glutamate/aspartate:proton symporter GltP [Neisseria sp. Ec49-e6-T10]|uniref:glutamate/aspartate:proton symporter GltP n=1 Tax=Neisseria sp. Ec49-e6-T10 TaxID=3140744 RepID=UPI003EB8B70B